MTMTKARAQRRAKASDGVQAGRRRALQALSLAVLAPAAWLASSRPSAAQGPSRLDPAPVGPQWIGLYNAQLLQVLEQPDCQPVAGGASRRACVRADGKPLERLVALRSEPRADAAQRGTLVLRALPGQRLEHAWRPPQGAEQRFQPDWFDADWGYGPWAHQGVLERRGDWFLLPRRPWPQPLWVNARDWLDVGEVPDLRGLEPGDLLRTPTGDLFVVAVGAESFSARPEQPADQDCSGQAPPLRAAAPKSYRYEALRDEDGHLRLLPKYMRGC
jgi:hypothetical protein